MRLAGQILVNTDGFHQTSVLVFITTIVTIFNTITQFPRFDTAAISAGNTISRASFEAEIGRLIFLPLAPGSSIAQIVALQAVTCQGDLSVTVQGRASFLTAATATLPVVA